MGTGTGNVKGGGGIEKGPKPADASGELLNAWMSLISCSRSSPILDGHDGHNGTAMFCPRFDIRVLVSFTKVLKSLRVKTLVICND